MNISLDLNTYKTRFGAGLKQYLFFVLLQIPNVNTSSTGSSFLSEMMDIFATSYGYNSSRDKFPYIVRSTNLPESTIDEQIINLQIVDYKLPGIRKFNDWTVTFNIDNDGEIISNLWKWQESIRSVGNCTNGYFDRSLYKDQNVYLLDGSGNIVLTYKLFGVWPKSIGQIQLDYSSNELATVDVTFSYQYYEINPQSSSEISNNIKTTIQSLVNKIF